MIFQIPGNKISDKVRPILVSYFTHMRININGSFEEKNWTLIKPFTQFIILKIFYFGFCAKNGPIYIESHMYKVTM